ncbi:CD209 antigen-like isoform X2 [Hoplias malabaricus]|uniref:CD209 antigen-like isoform X2 n=1 Tax=Hoplias malabaricus TaxID=27720 RepID=UPI003461D918
MENIYQNPDFQLSKIPRNEECPSSADVGDHTGTPVRKRSPLGFTESLKHVLTALSLLLLCALVGLCAVGVLYFYKSVSFEALNEDYSRAVERLSMQEQNASETETKYGELKVEHRRAQEVITRCSETERTFEDLKAEHLRAQERVSHCNETERKYGELKVEHSSAQERVSQCSETERTFEDLKAEHLRAQERVSHCNETERKYGELKVEHSGAQERVSQCSETERKYEELKVEHRRAQDRVSQCSDTERKFEELKVEHRRAQERISQCSGTERKYEELKVEHRRAQDRVSQCSDTERKYEELKVEHRRAQERNSRCSETEKKYEDLKVQHLRTQEMFSKCSGCQKCAQCGEGWTFFGVSCYYFSSDELNWRESRNYCTGKGGNLVVITSKEEHDFLSSRIGETHWIGLNDLDTEGQWMWVNNRPLSETRTEFWLKRKNKPNEPDNWKSEDSSGENCGALGDENGYTHTWFDASCKKLKKYICEK